MTIETDLLLSVLKMTKDGPVLIKCINQDSRIASDIIRKLLEKLQNEGMLYIKADTVEADSDNRIKIAVKTASLGVDVDHISASLRWQEFEKIAAFALERNGYTTVKNMRFKQAGRKWEIDVVGYSKPLVLCVDCKHWKREVKHSALRKIVKEQVKRARALAQAMPYPTLKVECVKWKKAKIVPVILSLIPSRLKFCYNVPIVPILQFQDFIMQLPAFTESLKYFVKEFSHL